MVELFAVGYEPIPEPVTARSRALPRCELPTLARLSEPAGTLTRIARCCVALWPEPPGWDLHPLRRTRPRRAKERIARQGVSPSPRQLRDRIEREDYSENSELSGLLSRASVEPDEHVSVHPALRVTSWRVVSSPP